MYQSASSWDFGSEIQDNSPLINFRQTDLPGSFIPFCLSLAWIALVSQASGHPITTLSMCLIVVTSQRVQHIFGEGRITGKLPTGGDGARKVEWGTGPCVAWPAGSV
jgi:hypothetical protein